jgi:hypothetical protein
MKGAMRLAQSLYRQVIEDMGFFGRFSRWRRADSAAPQKRDSKADSWRRKSGFRRPPIAKWQSAADLLEMMWQRKRIRVSDPFHHGPIAGRAGGAFEQAAVTVSHQ